MECKNQNIQDLKKKRKKIEVLTLVKMLSLPIVTNKKLLA